MDATRLQELETAFDASAALIRRDGRLWVAFDSLDYALLLLRRDQSSDRQRAAAIIEAVLATQMRQPAWDCGRFPMSLPETWRDLNATLFLAPNLTELHAHWLPMLPPELAGRFREAVSAAVEPIERRWADEVFDVHRDFKSYSNIFVHQRLCLPARWPGALPLRPHGYQLSADPGTPAGGRTAAVGNPTALPGVDGGVDGAP